MVTSTIWAPKGEQGDKGPDGNPGPQGPQGPEGPPGPGAEEFAEFKADLENASDVTKGAYIIGFDSTTVGARLKGVNKSLYEFGGKLDGITNDSVAVTAMIAALNYLEIPAGKTVIAKNIELFDNTIVDIKGTIKLPNGCVDFDKLFFATNRQGIVGKINVIDGNAAGQTGDLGTHLTYFLTCTRLHFVVDYIHDHYYPAFGTLPSTDGIRDMSTGAVFAYRCVDSHIVVNMLKYWGREGVQLRECTNSEGGMRGIGKDGGGEYSGLQISGVNNTMLFCNPVNAGASGAGFDTINGRFQNVTAVDVRENHGLNLGHTGFPATGSVGSGIVIDGCMRHGISIGAGTTDVSISNFSISNAGELGLNCSDGALTPRITNGIVSNSGQFNLSVLTTTMQARNVKYSTVDNRVLTVAITSGVFIVGETVTSGANTGVIRRVIKNRAATIQILFLSSSSGTFVPTAVITGGTSAATGTISTVSTPVAKRELSGGFIVEESLTVTGGVGTVTRLSCGDAIYRHVTSVVATASTLATSVVSFPSYVAWIAAPTVFVNVVAVSSTDSFNLERLSSATTISDVTVKLKASVAQTYSVAILAVGRWLP